MPEIAVLGLGNWGTALGHHLACKGFPVLGWSIDPAIVKSINESNRHPQVMCDVKLHPGLRATQNLSETLSHDVLLLTLPSRALSDVVPQLAVRPSSVVVSGIKGMEMETLKTPLQFCAASMPMRPKLAVLSGPSFARDVIEQRPVGVVAAAEDEETARYVAELFSSDRMRAYISTDPLGVEMGGIVKNIVAIAAGVSDGLGFGDSARAGLVTRGLAEMVRLAEALGCNKLTLFGLSGLGDLAMTASSDLSRNRVVGLRLGRGEKLVDILGSLGSVAEGVLTAPVILELSRKLGVEMPITWHVVQLLEGRDSPENMAKSLISRPIRREFE